MNSVTSRTYLEMLAGQIDSTLETLHVTMKQRIAKAESALAHTRNKIMSPIYRCPSEVLSEIFSYALLPDANPYCHTPMVDSLVEMYRTLHNLLSVCSAWKHVSLAQGSFWSTVPMVNFTTSPFQLGFPQTVSLSLKRASNVDLHLAAIIPHWSKDLPSSALTKHALQFRSINIATECNSVVSRLVDIFRGVGTFGRLSEIRIYHKSNKQLFNARPRGFDYVISPNATNLSDFNQIIKSLSLFRLRGAPIHLDQVIFSIRLVELDLQQFTLGYDSEIIKLMTALASATELHTLKIISVITFLNPVGSGETSDLKLSFPKLQTFLARDLYGNTFKTLLPTITSRTHLFTLHLTPKAYQELPLGDTPEYYSIYELTDVLVGLDVNTLLLESNKSSNWMASGEFGAVFESMPELQTLQMHNWDFNEDICRGMQRRKWMDTNQFPRVKNLHVTAARIWDEDKFKELVSHYSETLEKVELGVQLRIISEDEDEEDSITWASVEEGDDLADWLEENVPEFELVDFDFDPKEFDPLEWQLW